MSTDLFERENAEAMGALEPTQRIEAGAWDGFVRGTGLAIGRSLARTGRAVDLLGAVGPIAKDYVTGGTELQDRYFKEHDELFGSAVDYWTPKPGEVGIAGQITGELIGTLGQMLASPGLAVGSLMLGEAEDLTKLGVPAEKALGVGTVQGLGLGLGIYVPILGRTLTQRVLLGGAGFNVVQGVTTRGLSQAFLGTDPQASRYAMLDPHYLTLDVLLGLGFGGIAHLSPAMRAQGGEALKAIEQWVKNVKPSELDALAAMRQAQHLNADSMPGKPAEAKDVQFHVERTRQAIEQAARGQPIEVSDLPAPRFEADAARAEEANARLEELVGEAERIRTEEGIAPPPEPEPAPPARLVPQDLTLVHPDDQAAAIGRAVEKRLLDLKQPTAEAKAGAAIWEAFFDTAGKKYGVTPAALMQTYGIDIQHLADAQELPGAMGQPKPGQPEPADPAAARARIKEIKALLEPFARKGDLTGPEGARFAELSREADRLRYGLEKPAELATVLPAAERMSTLSADTTVAAHADLLKNRAAYLAIREASVGVSFNRETAVDLIIAGKNKDISARDLYDAFAQTRAKLQEQYGPTVKLYRATGKQRSKPTTNWATTRAFAEQFGKNIIERDVPVEQILAVHTGKNGKYHEVIVVDKVPEPSGERAAATDPNILYQSKAVQKKWYSELERQITAANMKAAPAQAWKDYLKGLASKGVKADEVKWSGIEEWLDIEGGRITKEKVLDYLKHNGVQVEESLYGGKDAAERKLDDRAIAHHVRTVTAAGYTPEVGPDGVVMAFVSDPSTPFDGDIVTSAEIRQAARDARRDATPADLAALPDLEAAATAAERIEAYWRGDEMPEGEAVPPAAPPLPEGMLPMGVGRRFEVGDAPDVDANWGQAGYVYKYDGGEYFILQEDNGGFSVPNAGPDVGGSFATRAEAEDALWDYIVSETGLTQAEHLEAFTTKMKAHGWEWFAEGNELFVRVSRPGEAAFNLPEYNVTIGEAQSPNVPAVVRALAERIDHIRHAPEGNVRLEARETIAREEYRRSYGELTDGQRARVDEMEETEWGIEGTQMEAENRPGPKFADYQLPGGKNYRELLLKLPPREGLPRGYSIKEQPAARNLGDRAIDDMQAELGKWQEEHGYAPQSADELRMEIEQAHGIPLDGPFAREIDYLKAFEARWEEAMKTASGNSQFVLVRPDGSGQMMIHATTKADAEEQAMHALRREGVLEKASFQGSHHGEVDVLAHVRFNERTDADGKPLLFIEEIQSDWAQSARKERTRQVEQLSKEKKIPIAEADKLVIKEAGFFHEEPVYVVYYETPKGRVDIGYGPTPEAALASMNHGWANILKDDAIKTRKDPGQKKGVVPAGPFVNKTEAWSGLVLKRMVRWAAENGFEKIAWTTGAQQVERYTNALRKKVDSIDWTKTPEGVQLVGYKGRSSGAVTAELARARHQADAMLGRNDNLGFESVEEARRAVLDHADWAERWDVTDRGAIADINDWQMRERNKGKGQKVVDTTQKEDVLSDAIGKSMADRIRNDPAQSGTIDGDNINVDDTGMAGYYDRILPIVAKDVLKKLGGGKVGTSKLETGGVDRNSRPEYRFPGRNMPEFDEMTASEREGLAGAEDFPDGEAPMNAEGKITIDDMQTDVELVIDKNGLHIFGTIGGEQFELLAPRDQFSNPKDFDTSQGALEAVDSAWERGHLPDMIELITGEVRAPVKTTTDQQSIDITPELRERALSGMPLFQGGRRGQIQLGKTENVIGLFDLADASTFVHESGHLFLQMTRDLASQPGAPLAAMDDWATLARWLKTEGGELTREQQEKFATSFERYLAEGKAPTEELKGVFAQFRDWLIQIYKSLANIAEDLPDEIRGVMDRMLASQKRDPAPKAEGPPAQRAGSEPPPPPGTGEAAGTARPEASQGDWRADVAALQGPKPEVSKRGLDDLQIRELLQLMGEVELGWAQIGGKRANLSISTNSGQPNFTKWIPKSELWPGRPDKAMNETRTREAVRKALAGEKLKAGEQRMVDYMLEIANERLAAVEHIGGPEEWNATAPALADVRLEPDTQNVLDTDLVARAAAKDEIAVERAAVKYENDDAGFMTQVRKILGKDIENQAAAGRGEEGEGQTAGERAGAEGQGEDPVAAAAQEYVDANPEQLLQVGEAADGTPIQKTVRQYLEDELQAAGDAREDAGLVRAAAKCLFGRA